MQRDAEAEGMALTVYYQLKRNAKYIVPDPNSAFYGVDSYRSVRKTSFFFFSSECTVMCFERFHLLLLYYCVEYLLKYSTLRKACFGALWHSQSVNLISHSIWMSFSTHCDNTHMALPSSNVSITLLISWHMVFVVLNESEWLQQIPVNEVLEDAGC